MINIPDPAQAPKGDSGCSNPALDFSSSVEISPLDTKRGYIAPKIKVRYRDEWMGEVYT